MSNNLEVLPHEKQIKEILSAIELLKKQGQDSPLLCKEIAKLEQKLIELRKLVYSNLSAWQRVQICRHPQRPRSSDYIEMMCDHFCELSGDRLYGDDPALIGGFATIGQMRCVLIGQEKGKDTQTRIERNFGMSHPEGYRKALRLMEQAAKFDLPVVTLVDTPGAYPCLEAEERGQGWAIAMNLRQMSQLPVPIISMIIGEGCSGGALGIAVADVVMMLEHSYYSAISPEGCASILWKGEEKDVSKRELAAEALKLNAEFLLDKKIIDKIVSEPIGGGHTDPKATCLAVRAALLEQWQALRNIPVSLLVEQRYAKYRHLGAHVFDEQKSAL